VVGPANSEGFHWHDGHLTTLRDPAANQVRPNGINDSGQTVGDLVFDDGPSSRAFAWQDGVFTELPTPRGANSTARAVNNRDDVAGTVTSADGVVDGFRWRAGRTVRYLFRAAG
jgi:probable HAF family extracellular repeat protein